MKSAAEPVIRLKGVRHNNLKNFDLDLPKGRLIVMTGLSGSGKSSLAFDTLFAEGQRRYIETFSPYARQFFDRMDKPQVDRIEGIPPAIAVEQTNTVRTTRSTVGTMTELCDYMKILWPRLAELYCGQCGRRVIRESPQSVWQHLAALKGGEVLVTFRLALSEKLSLKETISLITRQGYQRCLWEGKILRLEDLLEQPDLLGKGGKEGNAGEDLPTLTIIQDRIRVGAENRARLVEACEQAYHFGKGRLAIHPWPASAEREGGSPGEPILFSRGYHCAHCDLDYREPSTALFSFNHPVGACPQCKGFGRIITIDYDLALPDRSKSLAEGVVRPWQTGQGAECQRDLMKFCKRMKVPVKVPFDKLSKKWQEWVIQGEPGYGKDSDHQWPRAWYGVRGYFRWLESKAYKMHVRVLLSRYRAYSRCPECQGQRFQPEALLYRAEWKCGLPSRPGEEEGAWDGTLTLADFYALPVREALRFAEELSKRHSLSNSDPVGVALGEVRNRLQFLVRVGLGYLTLDRATRSLSGGETERVNLTTCLGSHMVHTLFVLDEPSVGLHSRDTERLVEILKDLRDAGNTVVVVEHEANVMRAADQIVDLGPGQGEAGGQIVFQGNASQLLDCSESLTGQYLGGKLQAALPENRPFGRKAGRLRLKNVHRHNLKNLSVEIPLHRFVCLTGVSGSGKTTLAREVLLPLLEARLRSAPSQDLASSAEDAEDPASDEGEISRHDSKLSGSPDLKITGQLDRVVLVDQSSLGRTPRSNPVVYVGAFNDIRELFAQTDAARQQGLKASSFSFNSAQGQCELCRGAGFEKIEMQFLSDVFIRCPDCDGRRYRDHILKIKLPVAVPDQPINGQGGKGISGAWNIADLLESTVDQVCLGLLPYQVQPSGRRALRRLQLLQEVGLGYLRLGQPINTLSGGESQRLKLAYHLAESKVMQASLAAPAGDKPAVARLSMRKRKTRSAPVSFQSTLFIFDEPTTGLHFHDVHILLKAFQRLVNAGHSLLVIEHNLDVIRSADHIIDLGPEGGDEGGRLVAVGTPQQIARSKQSHTGLALKETGPDCA